jgi:hypothetical protein
LSDNLGTLISYGTLWAPQASNGTDLPLPYIIEPPFSHVTLHKKMKFKSSIKVAYFKMIMHHTQPYGYARYMVLWISMTHRQRLSFERSEVGFICATNGEHQKMQII